MGVLGAVHATAVVMNCRRRARRELAQSWLAATPRAAATLSFAVALLTLWSLVWQVLLGFLLIVCTLCTGAIDVALAGRTSLLMTIGLCIGSGVGWYIRGRVDLHACGVLLATHGLDVVEHYSDEAALLLNGRIVHAWGHQELRALRAGTLQFEAVLAEMARRHALR